MIVIERYSDEKKEIWDSFIERSKTPLFMFKRGYMEYHKERFVDYSLLFFDGDKLAAVFPATRDGDVLSSHGGLTYGGLVLSDHTKQQVVLEIFEELILYIKNDGIQRLIYKIIPYFLHEYPSEEDRYALFVHNAKLIDVSASTAILLNSPLKMAKGRKAQISRARREGVTVCEENDKEYYDRLIEMENAILLEKHGTKAVHSADELYMLHERFPDNIQLFSAVYAEKIIAGVVLFIYRNAIHTQYIASDETARMLGGIDLIIDHIIEKYRTKKKWLDFGISTENSGRYLNNGLISQKEGFGGRTVVYEKYSLEV